MLPLLGRSLSHQHRESVRRWCGSRQISSWHRQETFRLKLSGTPQRQHEQKLWHDPFFRCFLFQQASCAFSSRSVSDLDVDSNHALGGDLHSGTDRVLTDETAPDETTRESILLAIRQDLPAVMEEIMEVVEEERLRSLRDEGQLVDENFQQHPSTVQDSESSKASNQHGKLDGRGEMIGLRERYEYTWRKHVRRQNRRKLRQAGSSMDSPWHGNNTTSRGTFDTCLAETDGSSPWRNEQTLDFQKPASLTDVGWDVWRDSSVSDTQSTEQDSVEAEQDDVGWEMKDQLQSTHHVHTPFISGLEESNVERLESDVEESLMRDIVDHQNQQQQELERLCLFLESMRASDWELLDAGGHERQDADGGEAIDITAHTEEKLESNNTLEVDEDYDTLEADEDVQILLDLALRHSDSLTPDEYNLILARVATSPGVRLESIMEALLQIYHEMKKHSIPDEATYKILLLTLQRRIACGGTAADGTIVALLQDMMDFNVTPSSDTLLVLGTRCLNRENNLQVAKRLVMDYSLERGIRVPQFCTKTLMKMLSREDCLQDAVSLLKKCIKANGLRSSHVTDAVLDTAVRWPDRNRAGQQRDITHVLQAFLEVITDNRIRHKYEPSFQSWRNLIVALSRTTNADPTRWELLGRPFHALFDRNERFYPDGHLLRIGLNYCDATGDSKLVRELLVRAVDQHIQSNESTSVTVSAADNTLDFFGPEASVSPGTSTIETLGSSARFPLSGCKGFSDSLCSDFYDTVDSTSASNAQEGLSVRDLQRDDAGFDKSAATGTNFDGLAVNHQRSTSNINSPQPPFSYKVFTRALKVCMTANDAASGKSVLDAFAQLKGVYPKDIESEVWGLALRGFSSLALDSNVAVEIFTTMKLDGLTINEESYSAVLHSFAADGQLEEAKMMFQEMKSGQFNDGVKPALACYNAMILASIKAKEYDTVMELYEELKASRITPNDTVIQGVTIAAHRLGGAGRVRRVLEEVVSDKDIIVSRDNCYLAFKILLPDVLQGSRSVARIQERLREMGNANELLQPACLNLLRSFRQADIEQRRLPTKHVPSGALASRQNQAWKAALEDIRELERLWRNLDREDDEPAGREVSWPVA